LTRIDEIVPSGSAIEKVRVTNWPVSVGFGDVLVMLTDGGLSFTLIEVAADPAEPLLSVAVTVMANACDLALPVFA
jgi:hypothetical protein